MNKSQRATLLRRFVGDLQKIHDQLMTMKPDLMLECDHWGLDLTLGRLTWAIENCHVLAEHQMAHKLSDDMGYYFPAGSRRRFPSISAHRVLPKGVTIERVNRRQLKRKRRRT